MFLLNLIPILKVFVLLLSHGSIEPACIIYYRVYLYYARSITMRCVKRYIYLHGGNCDVGTVRIDNFFHRRQYLRRYTTVVIADASVSTSFGENDFYGFESERKITIFATCRLRSLNNWTTCEISETRSASISQLLVSNAPINRHLTSIDNAYTVDHFVDCSCRELKNNENFGLGREKINNFHCYWPLCPVRII